MTCYICGKKLNKNYCLVSMLRNVDRVFLCHIKCSKQIEREDVFITEVIEAI